MNVITNSISSFLLLFLLSTYRVALPKTALNAEWEKDWKEVDFEGDLSKLQKEAEERLDEKIAELNANIAKTGAEN